MDIDWSDFPTTRYQGSKKKILPWIFDVINELEFDSVLDVFGGSASVSYLFKRMNKTVTYNDILKFNYYTGKALIENDKIVLTDSDIESVIKKHIDADTIIQKNFKGIYYIDKENKWLDNASYGIRSMNHYTGKELEYKKAIAYHSLFQASLVKRPFNLFHRNNLNLRLNDVDRTFGNKTTWEHPFTELFKDFIAETNNKVFKTQKKCKAINKSVFDIKNVSYDLVYLDPPYLNSIGTNETSNYLRCYHFLEGIANYEQWENLIDYNSVNLRFKNSLTLNSDFKLSTIHDTFDRLIEKFKDSIIVLSYKKGGTPSIEFLVKTMKKYKANVYTRSQHYKYALNKQNGDTRKNREVLIIGL